MRDLTIAAARIPSPRRKMMTANGLYFLRCMTPFGRVFSTHDCLPGCITAARYISTTEARLSTPVCRRGRGLSAFGILLRRRGPAAALSLIYDVCSCSRLEGSPKGTFQMSWAFADGPVGGEPRYSCDVEHARARPIGGRQPQLFDASLRCVIGIEIRCHHVVVGMP